MPIDRDPYLHCPTAVFATILLVTRVPAAGGDGPRLVAVDSGDNEYAVSEEEIARRGMTIEEHPAGTVYALHDDGSAEFRYRADWDRGVVDVEGLDDYVTVDEFRAQAVRTDGNGRMICALGQPAHVQLERVREAGAADLHALDIRGMVEGRRRSAEGYGYETGMYDLVVVEDMHDGLSDVEAMRQRAEGPNVDGSHPVLREAEAPWLPISANPHWRIPQVRQVYKDFLEPYLGGADIKDTVQAQAPDEAGFVETFGAMARRKAVIRPFRNDNVMPGYVTGEPKLYEFGGLTVLVFSDMMGSYAYAWRPVREMDAQPDWESARAPATMWDRFFGGVRVPGEAEAPEPEVRSARVADVDDAIEDDWSPW